MSEILPVEMRDMRIVNAESPPRIRRSICKKGALKHAWCREGSVGVDQARQLVDLWKVPVIIGSIISSVTVPMVTSVTVPAGVLQISPASSTPALTKLAMQGKTNSWFFRAITSDSSQGIAAAQFAIDEGLKTLAILYINNDFGVNLAGEFRRAYQALGGKITGAVAYDPEQSSYNAEVTRTSQGDPPALYFIGYPGDGTTIIRTWIQQDNARQFLFSDGMNTADFIESVDPQYLNHAYGTSSGTTRTLSSEYFSKAYPVMSGFDAASRLRTARSMPPPFWAGGPSGEPDLILLHTSALF
jgi:branched-chain amino acid transport system substrate-binding protein